MNSFQAFPGTLQHQHLLETVVTHYANDPRILAVIVFGSLGNGNWDPYSDLDLDVIIAGREVETVEQRFQGGLVPLPPRHRARVDGLAHLSDTRRARQPFRLVEMDRTNECIRHFGHGWKFVRHTAGGLYGKFRVEPYPSGKR